MAFTKADPKQGFLKVSMYGPPGSGKTFTSLLIAEGLAGVSGKRVAYVDTERGTDFYARSIPSRTVHPEAFDFDAIYTKSLKMAVDEVHGLDPKVHGVLVIDSISHLWDAAQEAYEGKRAGKDGDKIPFGAWAKLKKPYKVELLDFVMGLPMHVFILGRQKNVFEEEDNGNIRKVGVAMRAEGDTQYEPHICLRMETSGSKILMHVEKDRSGILSGKIVVDPSFSTIEAILPFLGQEQAPADDTEARVEADGSLLDAQDEKDRKKIETSEAIVSDMTARIQAALTLEELAKIAIELKASRKIMPEGKEVLRATYDGRRQVLGSRIAGGV